MKTKFIFSFLCLLLLGLVGCSDDEQPVVNPEVNNKESKYIRLLLAGQESNVEYFNLEVSKSEIFATQEGTKYLYPVGQNRYAAIVHSYPVGSISFFDSKIEAHGDHADELGAGNLLSKNIMTSKPTHFSGINSNFVIFNDAGSVWLGKESTLGNSASDYAKEIYKFDSHHGTACMLDGNKIAVTFSDGSTGALPSKVDIIDVNGAIISKGTVTTKGIHGDASNGEKALFGAKDGILHVDKSGTQRLVSYPSAEQFSDQSGQWIGTVLYGTGADVFVGWASKKGLYLLTDTSVEKLFISENISSVVFDLNGKHIIVLEKNGKLSIIDPATKSILVSKIFELSFDIVPSIAASSKFIYLTNPVKKEVYQIDYKALGVNKKYQTQIQASRVLLLGVDTDDSGNH